MASRQHPRASSLGTVGNDRDIMRPIISTDIMGNRNVEVVPVGAWVEPANFEEQPDAIKSAQVEDERLRQLESEKENRLRSFQREVKQRVWHAYQLKRQKLIEEAEQAFERERRVVRQSCLTGSMPRRDTCSHRQDDLHMAIRQRLMDKYGEDMSTWEEESPSLQSHTEESHKATGKARQQLVSRKIVSGRKNQEQQNGTQIGKVARDINTPTVRSLVSIDLERLQRKDKLSQQHSDKAEFTEAQDQNDNQGADNGDDETGVNERVQVTFAESSAKGKQHRKKRPGSSKSRPSSAQLGAILPGPGESEIAARLQRQQTAISRRVFMDREREAVREDIRRQQHKKKIASLKREKEAYRQQLETMAEQRELEQKSAARALDESLNEVWLSRKVQDLNLKDVGSNQSLEEEVGEETVIIDKAEQRQQKQGSKFVDDLDYYNNDGDDYELVLEAEQRRQDLQRLREMERYLDALRHRLMERVKRQGQELPALCACGETIWDTHPETCANNCFFYRNHRAYARALQSMLVTVENM